MYGSYTDTVSLPFVNAPTPSTNRGKLPEHYVTHSGLKTAVTIDTRSTSMAISASPINTTRLTSPVPVSIFYHRQQHDADRHLHQMATVQIRSSGGSLSSNSGRPGDGGNGTVGFVSIIEFCSA